MLRLISFLLLAGSFVLSFEVSAQQYPELKEFYQRVWSPYCKGNSLLECPSGQAEKLRDELRRQYESGKNLNQLEKYLEAQYGNQVRMEPKPSARGALAYLIPGFLFIFVCTGLALYWRKRLKPEQPSSSSEKSPTSGEANTKSKQDAVSKIEEELKERLS